MPANRRSRRPDPNSLRRPRRSGRQLTWKARGMVLICSTGGGSAGAIPIDNPAGGASIHLVRPGPGRGARRRQRHPPHRIWPSSRTRPGGRSRWPAGAGIRGMAKGPSGLIHPTWPTLLALCHCDAGVSGRHAGRAHGGPGGGALPSTRSNGGQATPHQRLLPWPLAAAPNAPEPRAPIRALEAGLNGGVVRNTWPGPRPPVMAEGATC